MARAYPGFCIMKRLRVLLLPPDGMLVRHRVNPSSMLPVPIYTFGWSETMWGKVSCLKQHDGRDWASKPHTNHHPTPPPAGLVYTKTIILLTIGEEW